MFNREDEQRQLDHANRNIAKAEERILAQRRRLYESGLEGCGMMQPASDMLATMLQVLESMKFHRDQMVARLYEADHSGSVNAPTGR